MTYYDTTLQDIDPAAIQKLTEHVAQNAIFLTPNTRLAMHLKNVVDTLCAYSNSDVNTLVKSVTNSVSVLSYDSWIRSHWNSHLLTGRVSAKRILTTAQDRLLWEQIVTQSKHSEALMSPNLAAQQAQQAYRLLRQWKVNPQEHRMEFSSSLDSKVLLEWIENYEKQLKEENHFTFEDAQIDLLASISQYSDSEAPPAPIVTVGFLSPTPLQLALIEKISGGNTAVIQLARKSNRLKSFAAKDFSDEIETAAIWARNLQKSHPNARIGIVIQDLLQTRTQVNRQFEQVFYPNFEQSFVDNTKDLFNLSAGVSLASCSLVQPVVDMLHATTGHLSIVAWQRLLLSRYTDFGYGQLSHVQHLIAAMYSAGEQEYDLREIVQLMTWHEKPKKKIESRKVNSGSDKVTRNLEKTLTQWLQIKVELTRGKNDKKNLPSQWLAGFKKLLDSLLWPGSHTLDSIEYQQHQVFLQCCDTFVDFDSVAGPLVFAKTVSLFIRHCQDQIFQAETTANISLVPVQVLGGLEASGIDFDYLWLAGLSDRQWPALGRPNPMLPRPLQNRLEMPSASKQREFFYSEQLTNSYLNGANEVVVSYPLALDDVATTLSPLILSAANKMGSSVLADENSFAEAVSSFKLDLYCTADDFEQPFEFVTDISGQSLTPYDGQSNVVTKVNGGVALLADQAKNPTRAYLKWRLGLRPLDLPIVGVSPLERGMVYHAALEKIWAALRGSAALKDLSTGALASLVTSSIDTSFENVFSRRFKTVSPALLNLERQCVHANLLAWMQLENERPDFLVEHIEQAVKVTVKGLVISMRIDRIDRLSTNDFMLIDYKSGSTRSSAWFEERISEPQLPLYHYAMKPSAENDAVYVDDEHNKQTATLLKVAPEAVSYATLRTGEMGFEGVSSDQTQAGNITGVKQIDAHRTSTFDTWEELVDHWAVSLENLAEEYKNGFAGFDTLTQSVLSDAYEPVIRSSSSFTASDLVDHSDARSVGSINKSGKC